MKEELSNFKERSVKDIDEITTKDDAHEENTFQEKPQICLIDIESKIKENLIKKGFNIESGTLSNIINVPNTAQNIYTTGCVCIPNFSFPENLHEYEIIVLDLSDKKVIPYD
jgi:hypothetical protein